jgi:transcriptional antiterminator RfaH
MVRFVAIAMLSLVVYMISLSANWYVLYLKPRMENRVYEQLTKRRIEAYLPTINVERQWHDRRKIVKQTIFPGYIFVKPTNKRDFFECQSIAGVCYFIKSENKPASIPFNLIEKLKKIFSNDVKADISDRAFKPGQLVFISSGPLEGSTCEVVSYKGKDRILVRLKIINRNLLLNLETEQVLLKAM